MAIRKIKLVWVVKPLLGEETLRFASFIGVEKSVQGNSSPRNFIMSRKCTFPNMKGIRSFDFL